MLIDPYRSVDPDFFSTFMLLHCEGGQLYERTGFPTVAVVGGGVVSATQAKFGLQSFSNPGTGSEGNNYISVIGAEGDFLFPGEFTFEGWFYPRSRTASFMNLFTNNINFPSAGFIQLAIRSGGDILWNSSPGGSFVSNVTVPLDAWAHLAISRDADDLMRIFTNGVLSASSTKAGTIGGNNLGVSTFDIGRGIAADNGDFDGFFEEIRVTKVCRYTEDFTLPAAPFPPFP